MRGHSILVASIIALALGGGGKALAGFGFGGPAGPRITGNDTGGIMSYSPALEGVYPRIAAAYCARWGRLSHVTSVHRQYGDYISFVCIDKPWVTH